jgi:hypothetical protein
MQLNVILTTAQLNKLNTRKAFQLSATQMNQGGTGVHQIQLNLNKKAYTKAQRHIRTGKGMRISPSDIGGDVVYGGKIKLKNILKIGKQIAKIAAPILAPAIKSGITYATGNADAGRIGNDVIQTGVKGLGFSSYLKTGSKYIPKSVVQAGQKALVKEIANRTGSNLAGDISNVLLSEGVNQTYNGSGFSSYLKTGSKYIPKSVVQAGQKALVKEIANRTGSNLAGDISNVLLTEGVNQTYNGGSYNPNGLPTAVNSKSKGEHKIRGSGAAKEHMAMVRASRKIHGGSFR